MLIEAKTEYSVHSPHEVAVSMDNLSILRDMLASERLHGVEPALSALPSLAHRTARPASVHGVSEQDVRCNCTLDFDVTGG